MRLTIVGCSGTLPGPGSPSSAYLVETAGFRMLVDCGNGAIGSLQRFGDVLALDAVVITHLHADHCLDLVPYSYARRYHPRAPLPRLPVYGPRDLQERLCAAFEQRPTDGLGQVYEFRTVQEGRRTIGPFEVDLVRMNHPVETYGLRIMADGASIAYSADTGSCNALVDLARNCDLFLCEASFAHGGSHPADLHLTSREAGDHARRAGARRLVLTHLLPWTDEELSRADAAAAYGRPVEVARTGATYELSVVSDIP
ncbi:MAG: MBL fold metallo-hydrolase [Frankiaceae bacterium]